MARFAIFTISLYPSHKINAHFLYNLPEQPNDLFTRILNKMSCVKGQIRLTWK